MSRDSILIVEDEAIVAVDIAKKVRQLGYDVTGATITGEDAIVRARQQRPSLVLMDIHLAGAMDGIAAAAIIRQECAVPVIFLTAHSDPVTVTRAREVDPFGYLLKPFDERELHIHIELALYKHATEQRLRESAERLAGLIGSAMDAIIAVDEEQQIVLFNAAAEKMFGLSAAAALGQPLTQLIPNRYDEPPVDHIGEFTRMAVKTLLSGALGELTGRRATGEEFPIEAALSKTQTAGGKLYTVILRDITERKRIARAMEQLNETLEQRVVERTQALQASEERFRQMAEHVQEVFWLANADLTEMLYVSPAFEKLWGHTCASLYANPQLWFAAVHPEDRESLANSFRRHGTNGTAPLQAEYRILRPDGSIRWISDRGTLIPNATGEPYRLVGVARDCTERKEAELAHARLAAIVESSTDAISAMSLDGVITDWTESAERLYGFTAAEALGQPISLIVPPDKASDIPLFIRKLKAGERIAAYETVRLRKDGQRFDAAITISPVRDATGRTIGSSGIARDITERKRLEAEIQRISETEKQRLGRDLHDGLSQQLTAIRYLASALQAGLERDGVPAAADAAKIVHELMNASGQTRDLVRALLPVELQNGALVPALQELATNVTSLFKIPCRVTAPLDIQIPDPAVASQLYRIAQEAAVNSAKHSHGTHIQIRLVAQRKQLVLSVKDNGQGLPKPVPATTGMGLRIMQYRAGIINARVKITRVATGGTLVTCGLASPKSNHHKRKS